MLESASRSGERVAALGDLFLSLHIAGQFLHVAPLDDKLSILLALRSTGASHLVWGEVQESGRLHVRVVAVPDEVLVIETVSCLEVSVINELVAREGCVFAYDAQGGVGNDGGLSPDRAVSQLEVDAACMGKRSRAIYEKYVR